LHGLKLGFWPKGKAIFWFICFFAALFTVHFSGKVLADWSVHIALFYVIMVLVDSVEVVIKTFVVTIAAMLINCIQSWKGVYLYGYYTRPTGSFGDANYYALGLIVSIAMAVCLYKLYPKFRFIIICSLLALFFTLLLTASRGGILGLGVMVFVFLLELNQFKRMVIYGTLITAISVFIALNFAPDTIKRLKGDDYSTKSSTENRIKTQIAGLNMIKDNWIAGVGSGNYKLMAIKYNSDIKEGERVYIAHNSYISVGAELGLPILFVFIMLIYCSYRQIKHVIMFSTDTDVVIISKTLYIAFVGYITSILFLTAEREKYLWLLIFLIMAFHKMLKYTNIEHNNTMRHNREDINDFSNGAVPTIL
jgi:O-antigen ligase